MAKEKPVDAAKAARKAEKKAMKHAKRSDTDGVSKSSKKSSKGGDVDDGTVEATSAPPAKKPAADAMDVDDGDIKMENGTNGEVNGTTRPKPIQGALVPFAKPLADDKVAKKVLKNVKKANKHAALKRGVKEVVKSLRKSSVPGPSSTESPIAVVVLAADISPMDVISHIPVLCEDHGVPYIFVTSRAELGAAGSTKRPTSVVMVSRTPGKTKKKKAKDGEGGETKKEKDEESWDDLYAELVKVVVKAGKSVKV